MKRICLMLSVVSALCLLMPGAVQARTASKGMSPARIQAEPDYMAEEIPGMAGEPSGAQLVLPPDVPALSNRKADYGISMEFKPFIDEDDYFYVFGKFAPTFVAKPDLSNVPQDTYYTSISKRIRLFIDGSDVVADDCEAWPPDAPEGKVTGFRCRGKFKNMDTTMDRLLEDPYGYDGVGYKFHFAIGYDEEAGGFLYKSPKLRLIDLVYPGEPDAPKTSYDFDWIPNHFDNCDDVYNPDQLDSDGDGVGDACQ